MYASSEVAEVAGVVVPAFIKATALYHRVAGHEEAPTNPSDDGANHVAGAAGTNQQAPDLLLVRFLVPSLVVIALPMTHFSAILCCFEVLQSFSRIWSTTWCR